MGSRSNTVYMLIHVDSKDLLPLEKDIISFIDGQKNNNIIHNQANNINIKLILEDIRRTAEYASDIAEAAMNQTIGEVINVTTSK